MKLKASMYNHYTLNSIKILLCTVKYVFISTYFIWLEHHVYVTDGSTLK